MQQKIFISRDLASESVFLRQLQGADFEVIGESLVEFRAVSFSSLPESDWIFFYSKQSVHFFFEGLRKAGLKPHAKLAVFGKGTAKALEAQLYQADFVGTGKPQQNATYFLLMAKGQRVLFPRAANSLVTMQKLLSGQLQALDLIVYDNQPRQDFALPKCDWLVFTSPLNASAYFTKYALKSEQQVLAIGATTAQALQHLGISDVKIAEEPSEMALAQLIRASIRP